MYYLFLVVGVVSVLGIVAWLLLAHRGHPSIELVMAGAGQPRAAGGDRIARLLAGERNEDKPCLTPVDCVQANRCAGHCGRR